MNYLKSEFYKLFHSKLFWGIPVLFAIVFITLTQTHSGIYVMFSAWGENSLGFYAFVQSKGDTFIFTDLEKTLFFSSWCLWIISLIFSVSYFQKDFKDGTIKLAYMHGIKSSTIFISKLLSFLTYFYFCYTLFHTAAFFYIQHYMKISIAPEEWGKLLKTFLLVLLILTAFSISCIFASIVINNTLIASTLLCVATFISGYLMMANWTPDKTMPILYWLSPMFYLMRISNLQITSDVIIYFLFNIIILLPCSVFLQKKVLLK